MSRFKYQIQDTVYNISGTKGIIAVRRSYEYKTGTILDYYVYFQGDTEGYYSEEALFDEKPIDSY